MYYSRRLRGSNRYAGCSLVTFASILFASIYDFRRLRGWKPFAGGSLVTFASILVRLQAKRKVNDYVLASFNTFMLCMILAGCAGRTGFTGGSLVTFASILFASIYDSRRLRGWNRFASGSLVTFASILVRLQAKREDGDFVLASFNVFMLCMILAGCAGGTVLTSAL